MFERLPGGSEAQTASDEAWWPGRGPRLLFLVRLARGVASTLDGIIEEAGLKAKLGGTLFPQELWHQSVSDRYADLPWVRERLMAAGGQVQVPGFTLSLDQIRTARNQRGSFNAEVRQRGRCSELAQLVEAINAAVAAEGLPQGGGHSPHATLSYGFDGTMPSTQFIPPLDWRVDALELVWGGGHPYRYDTLGRWQLGPPVMTASQPSLF